MESSDACLAKRRRFFGCKAWKLRHGLRKCLVGQVRVVLCGNARIGVAEQLGDREQVHAGLCQVRRVGVAQFAERYDRLDLGDFERGIEGTVAGGWLMGRSALIAESRLAAGAGDADFFRTRIATARYYAEHILPQANGLASQLVSAKFQSICIQRNRSD